MGVLSCCFVVDFHVLRLPYVSLSVSKGEAIFRGRYLLHEPLSVSLGELSFRGRSV